MISFCAIRQQKRLPEKHAIVNAKKPCNIFRVLLLRRRYEWTRSESEYGKELPPMRRSPAEWSPRGALPGLPAEAGRRNLDSGGTDAFPAAVPRGNGPSVSPA